MRSAAIAAIVLLPAAAHAQQETGHGTLPPTDIGAPHSDNLIDPAMHRSWREGEPRIFAALTADAGYLYLRPRGHFGYGMPFNTWLGLELNPIIGRGGYGAYAGTRFAIPFADLRIGARYFSQFQRAYLTPREEYDRLDLDERINERAKYTTLETELNVAVPAGPGDIIAMGSLSYLGDVPDGFNVFEETLRVVVVPPMVWRARGGYLFRWGAHNQHSIGPVVDVLDVPARDDSRTIRLGPVLRIQLSRHFDVRGSFVTTILSPDKLGLVGGDFTELGVRYRIATE